MLAYLDNAVSIGPNSPAGKRRGRGLNENLARELLELHTVGVDAGYSQADVTALARILTGWSIGGPARPEATGRFIFVPVHHEPGPQRVMGKTYARLGLAKGEAALRDLARHPATARHICAKLARCFVSDEPPPALVARLERAFLDSEGDLKVVAQTLVRSPEAWRAEPAKMRRPFEFVVAAARAVQEPLPFPLAQQALVRLGEPLWTPPSPKGYSDETAAWLSPEAITTRLDWAWSLARRIRLEQHPVELAEEILGPLLSPETRGTVARAESRAQALTLLLMSPEFQRR